MLRILSGNPCIFRGRPKRRPPSNPGTRGSRHSRSKFSAFVLRSPSSERRRKKETCHYMMREELRSSLQNYFQSTVVLSWIDCRDLSPKNFCQNFVTAALLKDKTYVIQFLLGYKRLKVRMHNKRRAKVFTFAVSEAFPIMFKIYGPVRSCLCLRLSLNVSTQWF